MCASKLALNIRMSVLTVQVDVDLNFTELCNHIGLQILIFCMIPMLLEIASTIAAICILLLWRTIILMSLLNAYIYEIFGQPTFPLHFTIF